VDQPIIEPLGPEHGRAVFSCGNETLDRYLVRQASQDARNRVAAPFVLRDAGSSRILGYYTLSAYAIALVDIPLEMRKRLPRYPHLPAVLLGRLAVDREFGGAGVGKVLLVDALRRSLEQSLQIAAMAVVIDAIDDAACIFYEHFGFQRFADHEHRLFLAMKTIQELFPR
jgi:GNAT superfamily N-acetyltransferase